MSLFYRKKIKKITTKKLETRNLLLRKGWFQHCITDRCLYVYVDTLLHLAKGLETAFGNTHKNYNEEIKDKVGKGVQNEVKSGDHLIP